MKKTFNQFKKGLEELYWPKAGDEAKFMAMHGQYKAADVGGPETHNDSVFKGTIVKKDESHANTDSEKHPDAESELKDVVKNMHSKSTDEILKTVSQLNLSTDPKHREIRDVLNKELMSRYKATLPHTMREEKEEDSEPSASGNEHPIMQLKAGVDRGGVNFKTKSGKTVKLSKGHSLRLLALHNAIDTAEGKSKFANAVHNDPAAVHAKYFGEQVEQIEEDDDVKGGDTGWRPMSKKTQELLARRRPARALARQGMRKAMDDKDDDKEEANEANDGNLANNAKPYDKVTRGDVIAGRLGKDEMGGKRKIKEDLDEARSPLDQFRNETPEQKKAREERKAKWDAAYNKTAAEIQKAFSPENKAKMKTDVQAARNKELVAAGRKPIGEDLEESSHELKGMSLSDLRDKKRTAENGRKTYERAAAAAARAGNDSEARRHRAKANQHDDYLNRINAAIKSHPDNPKNEEVEQVEEAAYMPPGYNPSPLKGVPMKPGSLEPINKKKPLPREFGFKPKTEAVQEPYAVGMAAAMKSTGDKPPLEKSTIKKAHKIARGIMKNEEIELEDELMTETIELDDGNAVEIDIELAERIADLFEGLTEENQEALAEMLHANLESFLEVVEFIENQLDDEEE